MEHQRKVAKSIVDSSFPLFLTRFRTLTNLQRLRHISLRFREEILEFSLTKIDANAQAQLLYATSSPSRSAH
jgi:hypothetical protein